MHQNHPDTTTSASLAINRCKNMLHITILRIKADIIGKYSLSIPCQENWYYNNNFILLYIHIILFINKLKH